MGMTAYQKLKQALNQRIFFLLLALIYPLLGRFLSGFGKTALWPHTKCDDWTRKSHSKGNIIMLNAGNCTGQIWILGHLNVCIEMEIMNRVKNYAKFYFSQLWANNTSSSGSFPSNVPGVWFCVFEFWYVLFMVNSFVWNKTFMFCKIVRKSCRGKNQFTMTDQ